jgi:hypothetical protein
MLKPCKFVNVVLYRQPHDDDDDGHDDDGNLSAIHELHCFMAGVREMM